MAASHAPPIPGFRAQALPAVQPPPIAGPAPAGWTASTKVTTTRAPYVIWLVASIVAAVLSYHLAPAVLARIEASVPSFR